MRFIDLSAIQVLSQGKSHRPTIMPFEMLSRSHHPDFYRDIYCPPRA